MAYRPISSEFSSYPNLSERKLFVPRDMDVPENLAEVTDACVSERTIAAEWDELARLAASIEAGVVTADVALARFASAANAGTPLHRAADQLGRLLRTAFLCDYLTNEVFRREMHRLLDHGESVHTLQRAIPRSAPSSSVSCRCTADGERRRRWPCLGR